MANRYWVGGGASTNWNATGPTNWSATSGGAGDASVPVAGDDVFFDANSGTGNSVLNTNFTIRQMDCTGYSGTLTHNAGVDLTFSIMGGGLQEYTLLFSSTMTYSADVSAEISITGSRRYQIQTFGQTLPEVFITDSNGFVSMLDDVSCTNITCAGTLITNGHSINANDLSFTGSGFLISGQVSVVQEKYDTGFTLQGGDAISSEIGQMRGQTFEAESDRLHSLILLLTSVGTPTDDVVVEIAETPDGSAIGTASLDSVSGFAWYHFTFENPVSLDVGEEYFIRISRSGSRDETNYYGVYAITTTDTSYDNGVRYRRDNLTTWGTFTGDHMFVLIDRLLTSTFTLNGTGTVFSLASTVSLIGKPEIWITNNSASAKTFSGGGKSYGELWNNTQGTGTLTIAGNNSFDTLKIDNGRTVLFTAGTTQTVGDFDVDTATLRSTSNGNTWTISSSSGTYRLNNATIRDSIATGGATFEVFEGINEGNNTGWDFLYPPTVDTVSGVQSDIYTVVLSGDITDVFITPVTRRGFVLSESSRSNPDPLPPEDSLYETISEEYGTFSEGVYSLNGGVRKYTPTYIRAFVQNELGIDYGDEIVVQTQSQNGFTIDNLPTSTLTPENQEATVSDLTDETTTSTTIDNRITAESGIINENTTQSNINNL